MCIHVYTPERSPIVVNIRDVQRPSGILVVSHDTGEPTPESARTSVKTRRAKRRSPDEQH